MLGWEWLVAGIGIELFSSIFGGEDEAVTAQKEMSREQLDFMKLKFGASREDVQSMYEGLTPYREAGEFGLETVVNMLKNPDDAKDLPGYALGLEGIQRMASARGDAGGGRHEKELMRYGLAFQDQALQPYMNLAKLGRMSVTPSGQPRNALDGEPGAPGAPGGPGGDGTGMEDIYAGGESSEMEPGNYNTGGRSPIDLAQDAWSSFKEGGIVGLAQDAWSGLTGGSSDEKADDETPAWT